MSKILFVQIIKRGKNRAQRERNHEVLGYSLPVQKPVSASNKGIEAYLPRFHPGVTTHLSRDRLDLYGQEQKQNQGQEEAAY